MRGLLFSSAGRWIFLRLSICVAFLVLCQWFSVPAARYVIAAEDGEPGALLADKSVEVIAAAYPAEVRYTITLRHVDKAADQPATAAISAEMIDLLGPQRSLTGRVTTEVEGTVSSTRVSIRIVKDPTSGELVQQIRWAGSLSPHAVLKIHIPVRVAQRCGADPTLAISNTAQVTPKGLAPMQATADFDMICPSYGLDDIEVVQEIVTNADGEATTPTTADVIGSLHKFVLRTTITNRAEEPLNLAFAQDYGMVNQGDDNTDAVLMIHVLCQGNVPLAPGESRSFESVIQPSKAFGPEDKQIPAAAGVQRQLLSRVRYLFVPPDQVFRCNRMGLQNPDDIGVAEARFQWRPWDVGDAPDSSNHFAGAVMDAYTGVAAKFATVADATSNPPGAQGPRHVFPRALHLGALVDYEPDADLGLLPTNIDPVANLADQDWGDDGVDPQRWILNDCQTTTLLVRVFIDRQAVEWFKQHEQPAYLNVWLDSIGTTGQEKGPDGDWADVRMCQSGSGKSEAAFEHIVIDYPVDVAALGRGLHHLQVPTGRVPWPITEIGSPAWVRVTLSEAPSNKTMEWNGLWYGDGRGLDLPFVTGETEDYRLLASGIVGAAADMSVEQQARWRPLLAGRDPSESGDTAAPDLTVVTRVRYANQGLQPAYNVVLAVQVTGRDAAQAPVPDIDVTLIPKPTFAEIVREDETIYVKLGRVDGGGHGMVLLSWPGAPDQHYISHVEVTSTEDADPADNHSTINIDTSAPRLGFHVATQGNAGLFRGGTTCNTQLHLEGMAAPGEDVQLWDHMKKLQVARADSEGMWSSTITELSPGLHRIGVSLEQGQRKEMAILVDATLPVDPMSLTFSAEDGQIFYADTLEWTHGGWRINLPPGSYTVSIAACSPSAVTQLTLQLAGATVDLADDDGDGVFTGLLVIDAETTLARSVASDVARFTVATGNMETEGIESVYDGFFTPAPYGLVHDAVTGAPLPDAQIFLLTVDGVRNGEGVDLPWTNVAAQLAWTVSGDEGEYVLSAPLSTHRLYVTCEGYQPYRTQDIATDGVINQVIALTPALNMQPNFTIEIGDNGFVPNLLAVTPGSVLAFVNTGGDGHVLVGDGWESGVLLTGERYLIEVDTEGLFTITDGAVPEHSATIIVDADAGYKVYMPVVNQ